MLPQGNARRPLAEGMAAKNDIHSPPGAACLRFKCWSMSSQYCPLSFLTQASSMPRPCILALDLEGTLISNAASQIPRPGLNEFLIQCHAIFPRIVMYTTVSEARFRPIAELLVDEGQAPSWFAQIEYVRWTGTTKDLVRIRGAMVQQCLLVDDFEGYIHPGQRSQWVRIDCFEHPYELSDRGLSRALQDIRQRLG